ncbi:ATP12 family chaperone protein [Altererythrobacter sp. MF3-039]|uniref:ATP12 family chaperone protein n=1 Tax=Altererythrobacter sp. MF3-039 TaxID=3252901 RepID=UPI00390CCACC
MKRFYREVTLLEVEGGWQVALDGRPVKTQKGNPQLVTSNALGKLLTEEWAGMDEEFSAADLPLRDLADLAIDAISASRDETIAKLLSYLDTDTLCYRAEPDEPLFHRQREMWDPVLEAFEAREGITLQRVHGIVHKSHPEHSIERLRGRMAREDEFTLAALTAMASLATSLCVALQALEPGADGETLWNAANLEEDWQAEQWGVDEQAAARRAKRQADFLKALEFARAATA